MQNKPHYMKTNARKYKKLLTDIGTTIAAARQNAVRIINTELVKANWEIGRHIVLFEQDGKERAEYGTELITKLSRDLRLSYGTGFSRRNVLDMRRFYLTWQKWQAVPAKLSWTHIITLLGVSNEHARNFYSHQAINEKWGYRELEKQIDASLYERLALSKDKKGVLSLSKKGHTISHPSEVIKDPYLLNFLQIPQSYRVTEKELEQRIIDNLQLF
jgi:hypothetical protein